MPAIPGLIKIGKVLLSLTPRATTARMTLWKARSLPLRETYEMDEISPIYIEKWPSFRKERGLNAPLRGPLLMS